MGYTTDFEGSFELNKPLTVKDKAYLEKFSETRRMARNVNPKYGIEGEFYVDGSGFSGQGHEENIINYNNPPKTQPGLWCQWVPNKEGTAIEWNGAEKFYAYTEWIIYLIEKILRPRKYILNGEVKWQGEEASDFGKIIIKNNVVSIKEGKRHYE